MQMMHTIGKGILGVVLAFLWAPQADAVDPEAIAKASQALTEWKLLHEEEAKEEAAVYVSSSLSGVAEAQGGGGVGVVSGLSALNDDQDRLGPVGVFQKKGIYATHQTQSLTPFGPFIGETFAVTRDHKYRGYFYHGVEFERAHYAAGRMGPDKVYFIDTSGRDRNITWAMPEFADRAKQELGKTWKVVGGVSVTGGPDYASRKVQTWGLGDWVIHGQEMEAAKYLPANATLPQVIKLQQSFDAEDAMKMQFDRIGRAPAVPVGVGAYRLMPATPWSLRSKWNAPTTTGPLLAQQANFPTASPWKVGYGFGLPGRTLPRSSLGLGLPTGRTALPGAKTTYKVPQIQTGIGDY